MDKKHSYAEFSSQLNDKNIIIFEFGRRYTKCGFGGEPAPRAIIDTAINGPGNEKLFLHDITDQDELKKSLGQFILKLYFKYLAVTPKEKRVVVVESVFCKSIFRNTLTNLFFEQLNVPSLLYVPDHLTALATIGHSTGLIVDIGAEEAISIAVVNGVTLLDGSQFSSLGAKTLNQLIYKELVKNNPIYKEYLKPKIIEDIVVKTCFVAPFKRGVKMTKDKSTKSRDMIGVQRDKPHGSITPLEDCYMLADPDQGSPATLSYNLGGHRSIVVPGNLREGACEILFEIFGYEHSLTTMIVETILMAPIDCRKELSENILIIGGLANLPGLEHRLSEELGHIDEYQRYERKIPDNFKFHEVICPKNYVSWLGASMFCSPNSTELRSTTRDKWMRDGKKSMRDWSDLVR